MNGELAALVALCLHGNDWLASVDEPAPALDIENSTFRYVDRVHATCPQRRLLGHRTWESDGIVAWLQFVRATGGRRLSLAVGDAQRAGLSDPVAASFANGGRWAVIDDAAAPRIWRSNWSVNHRDRADQRIWTVHLVGSPAGRSWVAPPGPPSAREDLRAALDSIKRFAESEADLDYWTAWFDQALRLLDDPEPLIPYNPDLAPETLPLESRQLLAAAVKAWVFGGMGSWNDLGFADAGRQAEYDERTDDLYRNVLAAFVFVVNGSLPIRP